MIKVLHIINGMGTGGAEKDIMNWYRKIDRTKIQFDFLIRTDDNFYREEIELYGGHLYQVPSFPKHLILNYIETREILKKHHYDAIHVHGNALIYILPLIIGKHLNIPVRIMHVHSTSANGRLAAFLHIIHRCLIGRFANKLIACSHEAGLFGFRDKTFEIVHNAIDLDSFELLGSKIRDELNLDKDTFVVGHVGRLNYIKNQKFVIEVFDCIQRSINNTYLIFVGIGPDKEALEILVREKHITDKVSFLGERSDVENVLSGCNIVLFPSLFEGIPLVVLEAQALGIKVLHSDKVNPETDITPFAKPLSLEASYEEWASAAIDFSNEIIECDIRSLFKGKGYDITSVKEQLYTIYQVGQRKERSILFISNTYFQLITILQLWRTVYKADYVDIIVSDHSANNEFMAENLRKMCGIRKVYAVSSKNLSMPKSKPEFAKAFFSLLFYDTTLKKNVPGLKDKYDLILFHNLDSFTYLLYYKYKGMSEYLRFEEGYNIYLDPNGRKKTEFLNEIIFGKYFKRGSLNDKVKGIWLYHPELLTYKLPYSINKLKAISKNDSELTSMLNTAFGFNNPDLKGVKFIIFEESFYADGIPIEDYKLFEDIIAIVGKENTAIKLHPRNGYNRFEQLVQNKFEQQFIPWELIQMNNDFSKKVFVTISSGSVLASALYFEESVPTIFCYKVIGHKVPEKYEYYITKIMKTNKNIRFYIPKNMDELKILLKKFS